MSGGVQAATVVVWEWLVAHIPVDHEFDCLAPVIKGLGRDVISSALSNLRINHKVLKVVGKRGRRYIYMLTTLDRPKLGHPAPKFNGINRQKRVPHHVMKQSDFAGTVTVVRDERQGIHHTTLHRPRTDRFAYNFTGQMQEGNRLLDEFTRTAQLASFSDDELFAELKRRLHRGN